MSESKMSVNKEGLAKALEALKTFDWGKDPGPLAPIHEAIPAMYGNAEAAKELEIQLAPLLKTDISLAAKDYIIRQLTIIASIESLPILASLLPDKQLSHRARMVIERMNCDEAAYSLREALPKVSGPLKVGMIGSLGSRRDATSIAALGELVADSEASIAQAAATALGDIGTTAAAHALQTSAGKAADTVKPRIADAMLACAERLLNDGDKSAALAVYKSLEGSDFSKYAKTAAKRGKLMAM